MDATVATAFVGLNSQVWLVHTHPEAFAFNNLCAALILWVGAPAGPVRGFKRVGALGLLAGLALSCHLSAVLLAPVGLWAVYRGTRESNTIVTSLVVGLVALATGLTPYAYVVVADSIVSFGSVGTFGELVSHFLREDYGTASLGAQGELAPFRQLSFWFVESFVASMCVGLVVLLLGAGVAARSGEEMSGRRALVATWLLAGPIFVLLFNIDPVGPQAEVVKRFHVLPFVVGAPLAAFGIRWLRERELSPALLRFGAVGAIGLMLIVGAYRTHQVYDTSIEDYLRNTLRTMPENAVVIGQGDHRYFGFQYVQAVEGVRPDVVPVEPMMLGFDWGVDRLRARLGVDVAHPVVDEGEKRADLNAFIDQVVATGRPVFVTGDSNEEQLREYQLIPEGLGWRVLGPNEPQPPAERVFATNERIYRDVNLRSDPPQYLWNPWGWSLYHLYTRVWQDVLDRCEAENAECTEAARQWLARYPDL